MAQGEFPSNSAASSNDEHWRSQEPIHEERHLKVICIGAGASGLLLAYKLQRSFENLELILYEKNADLGGTWLENKYPGCACDVPAHTYTWSFEPNPSWSSKYAGSDEILRYFQNFTQKYDLAKYCKFNHRVSKASWNTKMGRWDVEVANLAEGTTVLDSCDILVNAGGVLNSWRWPDIPGLRDFKGVLLHTARWNPAVDLSGKHVGLIGNGSSAIQLLPAIRDLVSKITTFIRSPTWILSSSSFEQHVYSREERHAFESDPSAHLKYRKELECNGNSAFPLFIADSEVQKATFDSMVTLMKGRLQNKVLEELIIPSWAVGCRRITPGDKYLETLASDKVEVIYGGIEKITEAGCVGEDGVERQVEILICATGFDTSYKPSFPVVGENGKILSEVWAHEAQSYLGMAAAGFPNYFMFVGPNSPIGNGPLLIAIEAQADYMLKMMNRLQTENIHSFSPKPDAVQDFIEHKDAFMKNTVWEQECRSWYKSNSITGKVTALWPGSTMHYLEMIAEPRYEDWSFKYSGNRFAYLGNGRSQTETERRKFS
ncbi:hypothetical protein M413DRAFT_24952 [Hebeloma cylindrosporum]|uniref:FAD/NAD(P)-binding domain-containing protein n=1 Tax=Hebeloma cylindrosporum TaxID=76867 RepID=A0A0C2YTU6_HEBCY|nr:hypothetical protein M413DRAFT_24952 [Hebeloma cylindrosporum h7]